MDTLSSNNGFVQFTLSGRCRKFLVRPNYLQCEQAWWCLSSHSNFSKQPKRPCGVWHLVKERAEQEFDLVTSQDLADSLAKHIKKYGAFSKITLSAPTSRLQPLWLMVCRPLVKLTHQLDLVTLAALQHWTRQRDYERHARFIPTPRVTLTSTRRCRLWQRLLSWTGNHRALIF